MQIRSDFDQFREVTYINWYHNIFDQKVSKFVPSDLLKKQIEEDYNNKLMKINLTTQFLNGKMLVKFQLKVLFTI